MIGLIYGIHLSVLAFLAAVINPLFTVILEVLLPFVGVFENGREFMRLFDILAVLYEPVNPLDNHEHLLSYVEPKLNEDGTCPIFKEAGDIYNLINTPILPSNAITC